MTIVRLGRRPGTLRGVRLARVRRSARRLAVHGLTPRQAALMGAAAVAAVAVSVALLHESLGHEAQALLLVVPVVGTAVLGGRRAGQFAAALATVLFLLILPPAGSLRLRFADDIVVLVVFMVVAFVVGGIVAVRVEVLGDLERQRAALLRSVSHDLRTPLAAITAGISELEDETVHGLEARRRILTLVGDEASRLDRLVGDLLSLARIQGGGLTPRRQEFDLGALVERCARRLERTAAGTEVATIVATGVPVLLADPTLLEQVVTNLVENALRHSPPGEPVEVAVSHRGDQIQLVVSDAGPGIAPEDVAGLFEPFRTGPLAGESGIGLAICEAVVKAHGGTIDVRGSTRGGAAFVVTLPLA